MSFSQWKVPLASQSKPLQIFSNLFFLECLLLIILGDKYFLKIFYTINFEFLWSVFSRIWAKYGDLLRKSPYSVQMWENTDQKNSLFEHFLRSALVANNLRTWIRKEPLGKPKTILIYFLRFLIKIESKKKTRSWWQLKRLRSESRICFRENQN